MKGDKVPFYEETLEDAGRFTDQPVLPFNAYGTMALARGEFEANSGSSQVFWLLKARGSMRPKVSLGQSFAAQPQECSVAGWLVKLPVWRCDLTPNLHSSSCLTKCHGVLSCQNR